VPKPIVLAPGHVKVIKKGSVDNTPTKFSLEELEDCKGQSRETPKS
jgi:hypothetical protein